MLTREIVAVGMLPSAQIALAAPYIHAFRCWGVACANPLVLLFSLEQLA
jgi:hypothetical protein